MAFDENAFINNYKPDTKTNSSFNEDAFLSDYKQYAQYGGSFDETAFTNTISSGTRAADIKSSQGLYKLAVQNGLQTDADRILARQTGENINQIFSGGVISDIFDGINALQYGVVGVLKGKSFSEGVRTRQSFTDKDAFGGGTTSDWGIGLMLDILVDPLTYIGVGAIAKPLSKIPGVSKGAKAAQRFTIGEEIFRSVDTGAVYKTAKEAQKAGEAVERLYKTWQGGIPGVDYAIQKLAYYTGKDPIYLDTYERSIRNIGVTSKSIIDFGKVVSKIDPVVSNAMLKVGKDGRFIRESLDVLQKTLSPEEFEAAASLYKYIDDLGAQAVDLGLLSKSKYEENIGEYLKAAYEEFETVKNKLPFGYNPQTIKGIKKRKEVLTRTDAIDNPAYLLMKSSIDLVRDVENAKMFREINKRFARETAMEGFSQMPTSKGYGDLAGKFVPKYMAENLSLVIQPPVTKGQAFQNWMVGNFKFAKVVMNPATHARNIVSNRILNYWKLGMNPLDPRTMKAEVEATREIVKGTGKWIDEATPFGYNLDTFAAQELKGILESKEMTTAMSKYGNRWQSIKRKLGDIYQAEENHAKLAAYIYQRTVKNMEPEEAWKAAVSATFDYAAVTPLIRKLRTSIFGMPFITFTYKATPLAIETALKNPGRIGVIGKIKNDIERYADIETTERERASEPPWVKDGFYVKLPGEDPEGRSRYFDLTYILPFGDLVSGSFFERGMNMETGTPESVAQATIRKSPFIQLVGELAKNQDFYGNNIWKDSDSLQKQNYDILRHVSKTFAPPLVSDQIPGGYNDKGERQQRGIVGSLGEQERMDQQRTFLQELARNTGFKIQPLSADIQEQYQEWNRKKALETLLQERGVLNTMEIKYIPK